MELNEVYGNSPMFPQSNSAKFNLAKQLIIDLFRSPVYGGVITHEMVESMLNNRTWINLYGVDNLKDAWMYLIKQNAVRLSETSKDGNKIWRWNC